MSEWDNTPWAGTPVAKLSGPVLGPGTSVGPAHRTAKSVLDILPWSGGPPLSSLGQEPQQRMARFLQVYKCGWFYKAERKISGDIAKLEWTISDGDAQSEDPEENVLGRPDLDIAFDDLNPIDQLQRLLERPNPSQTGRQLFAKTQIRRDFAGTAMWYLENAEFGLPTAIYGVSPARMWPARDKAGVLIGWVMDKDTQRPVPFDATEIVNFPTASADDGDGDLFGVGVVEAVYAQVPLTDLIAKHTTDLLTTGGRLAGMLWPKDRTLTEDEFVDAQRAWRNVASDSNAARRLLLFPEPMEWSAGASTPAELGLPELAALNRDEILTGFPVSPEMLGVPMPSGLNASGESRQQLRKFYWEDTIQPRTSELIEVIQTHVVSRYEAVMGQTFDFDINIPSLDDAAQLIEKVGALKGLVSVGFDAKEAVAAVALDHIKWTGLPDQLDPAKQLAAQQAAQQAAAQQASDQQTHITESNGNPRVGNLVTVAKSRREQRDQVVKTAEKVGTDALSQFFAHQRERLARAVATTFPASKAARKALPEDWWDQQQEDDALTSALRTLYLEVGRGSLQVVADEIGRFVYSPAVKRILGDLLAFGGSRITDINERTRDAVKAQLAEGVRRGYSITQLTDGVEAEGFAGVKGALLDNGVPAFDGYRAEMIARTETALSFNRSAISGYDYYGIKEVQAIDGDGDEECAARDGRTFDIDEAYSIEDHPNGTLDWIPVIPEAGDKSVDHEALLTAIKALETVAAREPTHLTLHVEPGKAPDVHLDSPIVNVAPAEVSVQPPDVTVNVAAAEAPVVNVTTPDVHVDAPVINVAAPVVHTPEVTVKVPKADPPVVNVTTPEVTVNVPAGKPPVIKAEVTVSPEMRITAMPDRVTQRRVTRDNQGRITETTDVETDA